MATTNFVDYTTVVPASWLNDVDALVYEGAATQTGGSVSHVAGASGDVWLWTRSLSGSKTVGADVALTGYSPSAYMFDILSDSATVSDNLSFLVGNRTRHLFGGSTVTGGRIGNYTALLHTAATSSSNTNRNYVAVQGSVYAQANDGGTNTGADAKGAYFGGGFAAYSEAAATNLLNLAGVEINTFSASGSTAKYLFGLQIACANATRGATYDAAIGISGIADTITHAGFGYGILFHNANGAEPFSATSTIIGSVCTNTVSRGIDFSAQTITNEILKGKYSSLSETTLYLGDTGGNATIAVNGASSNANLLIYSKGTGSVSLVTSSGATMFRADATASAVNYLVVAPAIATGSPVISAQGSDTNIDILFNPKGTGVLKFGTHTAKGAEAFTGYITIKDSGGTERKVMVCS